MINKFLKRVYEYLGDVSITFDARASGRCSATGVPEETPVTAFSPPVTVDMEGYEPHCTDCAILTETLYVVVACCEKTPNDTLFAVTVDVATGLGTGTEVPTVNAVTEIESTITNYDNNDITVVALQPDNFVVLSYQVSTGDIYAVACTVNLGTGAITANPKVYIETTVAGNVRRMRAARISDTRLVLFYTSNAAPASQRVDYIFVDVTAKTTPAPGIAGIIRDDEIHANSGAGRIDFTKLSAEKWLVHSLMEYDRPIPGSYTVGYGYTRIEVSSTGITTAGNTNTNSGNYFNEAASLTTQSYGSINSWLSGGGYDHPVLLGGKGGSTGMYMTAYDSNIATLSDEKSSTKLVESAGYLYEHFDSFVYDGRIVYAYITVGTSPVLFVGWGIQPIGLDTTGLQAVLTGTPLAGTVEILAGGGKSLNFAKTAFKDYDVRDEAENGTTRPMVYIDLTGANRIKTVIATTNW